jgi:hypothetical protein
VVGAIGRHLGLIALFAVPSVVLWWHVWSGHPASTLTCDCGDPAQQVWFTAWPAYAIAHLHDLFFSGAVNVPDGANLLSNTSGTLVGVVLAPVTWAAGPVVATNVGLTLAPALTAWGCYVALRPLVRWRAAAIPAALVFGYSSAVVTSLFFGHLSVTVLVVPPLLFTVLHEIVIRQEHSVRADGLALAGLLVVQFLISPEVLVMCLLLGAIGMLAVIVAGWLQVQIRSRARHALPALGLGVGLAAVLLAYPVWFGLFGPQAVTGVLFAIAPLTGVPLSGLVMPGYYKALAGPYLRFGGYEGHVGPPPDYLGPGLLVVLAESVAVARRRPIVWLLLFMTLVTIVLSLGSYLQGAPPSLAHVWLPWRYLGTVPVLKEILPDQITPLIALFIAFLLAIGLDAFVRQLGQWRWTANWSGWARRATGALVTACLSLLAVVPVFVAVGAPLTVEPARLPAYMATEAPKLPAGTVLLTIPFAVTGSASPMLWQAVNGMHFRMAGAALKTPSASGAPVGTGSPGSARRILSRLSTAGSKLPAGTPAQIESVRLALARWKVDEVVIVGPSPDPVYASGFFTMALGFAPVYDRGAWVWPLPHGPSAPPPAMGASLHQCRDFAATEPERGNPLAMSGCVLTAAGHG